MIRLFLTATALVGTAMGRPTEDERVELWHKEGNVWPPEWQPETDAFKRNMEKREVEIMALAGSDERWENWLQFTQSRLVPRFTDRGFEVIQTPKKIQDKLAAAVNKALENWEEIPSEGDVDVIHNDPLMDPKFVHIGSLSWSTLNDLKELHEQWAGGVELTGTSAYGIRMYQNGSSLVMHYDRVKTHVISSIVHVTHEYDDDENPWPIQIEDHDGNLHEVNLEPGQMLFYESSKCLHGRMKIFRGKYYGSIFLHYAPVDPTVWNYDLEGIIASVPPHWRDDLTNEYGSRFSGACLTIDSRVVDNAPPRTDSSDSPHEEL